MKVLVMGGTRFNGLALVRQLVAEGHAVTVFNRGKSAADLPAGVARLYGDRHDHESLADTIGRVEYDCVHDVSAYTPDDVRSMIEILAGRVGHYVFASSTVMYARANLLPITESHPVDRTDRQSEYGMNKILCEKLLVEAWETRQFPATMVPFSMVFGPNNIIPDREQRMFVRMLTGRPVFIAGDGTTIGQVGHVDDQARALVKMMGNPATFGNRYNLTGKDFWTDEGYIDTFADVLGVEPNKVFVPPEVMDDIWQNPADTRFLIQSVAPNIHPWNESVVFSIDRLRADIDWEPEYTLPTSVAQTYEWFCREGLDKTRTFDFGFEDALRTLLDR